MTVHSPPHHRFIDFVRETSRIAEARSMSRHDQEFDFQENDPWHIFLMVRQPTRQLPGRAECCTWTLPRWMGSVHVQHSALPGSCLVGCRTMRKMCHGSFSWKSNSWSWRDIDRASAMREVSRTKSIKR